MYIQFVKKIKKIIDIIKIVCYIISTVDEDGMIFEN